MSPRVKQLWEDKWYILLGIFWVAYLLCGFYYDHTSRQQRTKEEAMFYPDYCRYKDSIEIHEATQQRLR